MIFPSAYRPGAFRTDSGGSLVISNTVTASSVTRLSSTDATESFTIPAGTFARDGDQVLFTVAGSYLNNTGSGSYIVSTATLGGTLISDPQTSGFSSATAAAPAKSFWWDFLLTRVTATTGTLAVNLLISNAGATNGAVSGSQFGGLGGAGKAMIATFGFTLAPASANSLVVTLQHEVASAEAVLTILFRRLAKV